ncbi:MAG: ubiquinol-cytochrome c reductase iron-sulfur subunit [Candidatus Methanofastidiosia archaeon]
MAEEKKISRRSFLDLMLGAVFTITAFIFGLPILKYLFPPKRMGEQFGFLEVATIDEIPVGGEKDIVYNGKSAAVTHPREDLFLAMYRICTHLGCIVPWDSEREIFQCPCHDGRFDIYGKNIYGPPPRPFWKLEIEIVGEKILVGPGEEPSQ